jgi:preprotein translocase subunit SecY
MFETLKNAFKVKDVRKKILMTLLFVLIYRIGSYIPVPGINSSAFTDAVGQSSFLDILSAISGGALANGTLFAIGISPYINASIIIQLLTIAIPYLERLSKQGDEGRKKITKITRYVTVILAIIQAVGIILMLGQNNILNDTLLPGLDPAPRWVTFIFVMLILVAGSSLTMWIGERITEYGVSNGMSMLIFVGIIATAGQQLISSFGNVFTNGWQTGGGWDIIGFLALAVVLFAFIVLVDKAERKIQVQYSKQIKGNKMYGGQSSTIPIKVNGSGVLPLIFAFAITSFPELLFTTFWNNANWVIWYQTNMGTQSPVVYPIMLTLWIFLFAFFYQQVQFNPVDVANNIQNNGGFIPGIRPGKPTSDYLTKVVQRITFFGATFLAIIAFIPTLLFQLVVTTNTGLLNAFSATGMLIVVSVALEFEKQLENQLLMKYYKGFLK